MSDLRPPLRYSSLVAKTACLALVACLFPIADASAATAAPGLAKVGSLYGDARPTPALPKRQGDATPAAVAVPISVYRNKEFLLGGFVAVNPFTCEFLESGSYTTTQAPLHGVLNYRIETLVSQSGACIGRSYPFNVAYYTWTDSAAAAGATDRFATTYSSVAGRLDLAAVATLSDPTQDAGATGPRDVLCPNASISAPPSQGVARGCAIWSIAPLTVSLSLHDIPLSYRPPRGPAIDLGLYYAQRDPQQSSSINYGSFGPQWTTTWLSFVTDTVATQKRAVLYQRGGGTESYAFSAATSTASDAAAYSQAVLTRSVAANGATTGFTRRLKDGSAEVFTQAASAGRFFMTAVIDPQGNRVTLTYDAQTRLLRLTDAAGRNTVFTYSTTDTLKIARVTDPFGRFAAFTYSGGRLASITDTLGLTSSFTYGPNNFINKLTTPYGVTSFTFGDASTNPALGNTRYLTATDPLGQTSRVEFNERAPGIATTAPAAPTGMAASNAQMNQRNTYIWNPAQHRQATANGGLDYTKARIIHWLRSADGATVTRVPAAVKEPLEAWVWNDYAGQPDPFTLGSSNLPLREARVLDDGSTQATSSFYNAAGNMTQRIDPVGRKTVFGYDPAGIDLLTVQQQTSAGGTLATIAALTYNTQHLPLTSTDAAGQTTRYAYNIAGQITGTTDALNQTTGFAYDGFGRLISTTNANGVVQQSQTFDAFDRAATRTDSEGYTLAYAYDAFDRVTEIRYPDGTTTQNSYDKLDLATVKDRLNRVTGYTRDALRRLTAVTDPLGQKTLYGYAEDGSLTSLTDPKGNVTRWDIDLQGRQTAKRYANGNVETYAYEAAASRMRAKTDAMGQVKTFGYTLDDRVRSLAYTSASRPTAGVSFTFDAFFPRLAAMADGIGTTIFQYHPPGAPGALQLSLEDGPYGNDTVAYEYDAIGRVATRTVDAAPETFAYDALSRTTGHSSPLGAFTRAYLGQTGQLTSQTASTGVGTAWSYEGNTGDRRLKAIANSGQARSFGFATDAESRITGIAESVGATPQRSWTYGYDNLDRLLTAQPSTGAAFGYAYDAADNLTGINGTAATYNAANQIVSFGGVPFSYDANGNLLDDGLRSYQWDAEDRLVGIRTKAQAGTATTLRYDGMGRRLAIADTGITGTTEVRHLWCGETLCQGRNGSDQVTRRYYSEGAVIPQSGQQLYYGTDQLGSVRDLLAMQNGSKVAGFDYDPYGNPIGASGRVSTEFRYAGLYFHGQSGLYLANYRAYNPRTAQWLSRDPITEEGGLNLYSFANGDPNLFIDPHGNTPLSVFTGAIGGLAGVAGNLGTQLVQNDWNLGCVNWKNVGIATGVGAVSGALAPFIASTWVGTVLLGSGSNLVQYGITQTINGDAISGRGAVWNAGTGAIGGIISGKIKLSTDIYHSQTSKFLDAAISRAINQDAAAKANLGTGNLVRNILGALTGNIDPSSNNDRACICN